MTPRRQARLAQRQQRLERAAARAAAARAARATEELGTAAFPCWDHVEAAPRRPPGLWARVRAAFAVELPGQTQWAGNTATNLATRRPPPSGPLC